MPVKNRYLNILGYYPLRTPAPYHWRMNVSPLRLHVWRTEFLIPLLFLNHGVASEFTRQMRTKQRNELVS